MSKRMIPSLLCAGIIACMTATPLYANTAAPEDKTRDGSEPIGKSGMETSKTVTLNDDGTYTIDLEAYATGSTTSIPITKTMPLDIVLVMDQSSSLSSNLIDVKNAAREFVQNLHTNATNATNEETIDHRVAIVGFTGTENARNTVMFVNGSYKQYNNLTNTDYADAFMPVTNLNDELNGDITDAIDGLAASGDTRQGLGLKMANKIFENNPVGETRNAKRVTILFTDGNPAENGTNDFNDSYAAEAVEEAYKLKNTYHSDVYTVGFYNDEVDRDKMPVMMNLISSNYPLGKYASYVPASNVSKSKRYYVQNADGDYVQVSWKSILGIGGKWYDSSGNTYDPNKKQFYSVVYGPLGEKTSEKFFLQGGNVSDLTDMFETIVTDVTNPSTDVSYSGESVIRDVIENGFTVTPQTQVSLAVYKGTATSTGDISFDRSVDVKETSAFQTQNNEGHTGAIELKPSITDNHVDVEGFNFSKNYVALGHDGYMIKITIDNVLPDEATATFNSTVYTNGEHTGIYENKTTADADAAGTAGDDLKVVRFPRPTTYLADKAYVVDYAKRISMDAIDWKLQTVKNVSSDYQKFSSLADGINQLNSLSTISGKFASKDSTTATYTPTTTDWTKVDKFFAFGETYDDQILNLDAHKTTKNLWSRVSVLPANSVYYEDTFVSGEENGRVGIEYTGSWTQTGDASVDYSTSKVHGHWSDASNGDSDGTHHVADAANGSVSTASYSFTGTGTDIYSRTNMESGTIVVQVTGTKLNEKNKPAYRKTFIIDTKSFSSGAGDYFTIPTFSVMDLPYDTYTVKLTVTSAATEMEKGRTKYYLDGIRVYNPLNDGKAADGLDGVYEGEFNAHFNPVKDIVKEGAAVFIDEITDADGKVTAAVGKYDHANSPANEIYLNKQQQVVIKVPEGTHDKVYVGLKAHDAKPVAVQVNTQTITVSSTMDQYWEVTPDSEGCIVIKNTEAADADDNLLAITNIRTANTEYKENADAPVVQALSEETALASYQTFMAGSDNGEEVPDEDVEIDNGDDDEVDSDSEPKSWLKTLFEGLFGWFH